MAMGFLIMQIGNVELDIVCDKVLVPALEACGLEAKRVDKHNRGELLKSEIIRFIEKSDIIVADLSNERPNCYLEIGYAMGIGKFANLVLTCRDDHRSDSPEHKPNGPKVHFDLGGYDILFWRPDRLTEFREELVKRIRRRLAILAPGASSSDSSLENQWIADRREAALEGLKSQEFEAYMEVHFTLLDEQLNKRPLELLSAAESATMRASGWPIAVVLTNNSDARPKPTAEGIVAEIKSTRRGVRHYDYWALRRNGSFYLLQSLPEDNSNRNAIYFDKRITRVAETVLYSGRIYNRWGVLPSARLRMSIKHVGLKDRQLLAANPRVEMDENRTAVEDETKLSQIFALSEVESRLVELVKAFTVPLFELFEFCEFSDAVYDQIVNGFVKKVR
jgi:hypothetical protein